MLKFRMSGDDRNMLRKYRCRTCRVIKFYDELYVAGYSSQLLQYIDIFQIRAVGHLVQKTADPSESKVSFIKYRHRIGKNLELESIGRLIVIRVSPRCRYCHLRKTVTSLTRRIDFGEIGKRSECYLGHNVFSSDPDVIPLLSTLGVPDSPRPSIMRSIKP